MPSYDKELRRANNGVIVRYVGQNSKGTPEKFRLGYDLAEAGRRTELIRALWREVETKQFVKPEFATSKPYWEAEYLEAAKAIAKGKPPTLPKNGPYEDPTHYLQRLGIISVVTDTKFEPANPVDLELALSSVQHDLSESRNTLSLATNVPTATGQTLGEAFDAYEAYVRRESTHPDGSLSPWGRTKLDQIRLIRSYLQDERFGHRDFLALDLAELTFSRCDEIYGVFRRRPPTLRSGLKKRMTPASAKNFNKEIGNLFDWLDGAEEFEWVEPRRFRTIVKTPDKLTAVEQYERREGKKRSVIPTEHLRKLLEYSLPIERALLLLGLNCAFGAAEVGHLRTGFLRLDEGIIDGIRFKTGNETRHQLWPETLAGLKWVLERRRRERILRPEYQDVVFLTDRGKPLWHNTKDGTTSNGVANIWYRLVRRVQGDEKGFPSYSFNKLRKTSATRILELADAETASMALAHNTISEDKLLENYALIPWKKLFAAQEQFRAELGDVLGAGDANPWDTKRRIYIGLKKLKRIFELHESGVAAPEIARQLGVSTATVHRQLQTKLGKRRPGRRRKPKSDQDGNTSLEQSSS